MAGFPSFAGIFSVFGLRLTNLSLELTGIRNMVVNECVSFLLISGDKVLVERRKLTKRTDPGLIAIPGGHVEKGEASEQALVREMSEELSVEPIKSNFLCTLYHQTNELQLIHYFAVTSWSGEIENHEAEELLWVRLDDPSLIDIDADKIAVREFVRMFK